MSANVEGGRAPAPTCAVCCRDLPQLWWGGLAGPAQHCLARIRAVMGLQLSEQLLSCSGGEEEHL